MNKSVVAGKTITLADLTWKRPGNGISPKYIDDVVGRQVRSSVEIDAVLHWNMLS